MSAAHILREAETLKSAVSDTSRGANEAWVSRQTLQDLYQKILVFDLEYALDKKVEQDLWNHAFKNQINTLQNQAKDKQNPKRGEIQSSLNLFLETASGFYLQLLQEICSAFKLDLAFRRKSSNIGILKEYGPVINKIKVPKKSSCLYICQHCLVHLGDIARYRQQVEQAQTYYRHAARLVPYNGQPYNQLAILEAAKGNKLSTVFYYIRSIVVKHPFPVASTNLDKFFTKLSKDSLEHRGKLSMSEIISTFLQFHAFIHLDIEYKKAKYHGEKLVNSLPTHITSMSFSSYQLVQMVAINLFALDHASRKLYNNGTQDDEKGECIESLSDDEQKSYNVVFELTVSVLENLLHHTPKQEAKAKEYHTLPVIKVLFDWIRTDREFVAMETFKNSSIWPNLSKLLNNLQFNNVQKEVSWELEKYSAVPLPEDCDLQCFMPILKTYSELDFHLMPNDGLSSELELRLRCHRMIENGLWICEEFPSLNLLNVTKLKSGRLQFSAPTAQVRLIPTVDSGNTPEKKSYRQNVAIQAIMQCKAKKGVSDESNQVSDKRGNMSMDQHYLVTEKQAISTPSSSDAGVSTHDPCSPHDTSSLSGGESGSDSNRSEAGGTSPSQHPASFPHGMFQLSYPAHTMSSKQENKTDMLQDIEITRGIDFKDQSDNRSTNILPMSRDIIKGYLNHPVAPDKHNVAIETDVIKVSQISDQVNTNLDHRSMKQVSDYCSAAHNRGQISSVHHGCPESSINIQHRPSMSTKLQNTNQTLVSPAYHQLPVQHLARQPFLSQSQHIHGQAGVTRTPNFGHSGIEWEPAHLRPNPMIPAGMSAQIRPIGIPPQSYRHPPLGPIHRGIIGHTSPLNTPGSVPTSSQVRRSFQGDPTIRLNVNAEENPRFVEESDTRFRQSNISGSLSSSCPTSNTFGQALLSQTSIADVRSGTGHNVGGLSCQSAPFLPIPGRMEEIIGSHKPSDSLLPQFSVSHGINVSFNPITEEPPKPDSPPTRHIGLGTNNLQSDMLHAQADNRQDLPAVSAPYVLFGQSPWPVGVMTKDPDKSSSPFDSNTSSVRTTPDPFHREERAPGINISLGYNFAPSSGSESMWSSPSSVASTETQDIRSSGDEKLQFQPNNLQTLWSSQHSLSPLEKLLERQRKGDPH